MAHTPPPWQSLLAGAAAAWASRAALGGDRRRPTGGSQPVVGGERRRAALTRPPAVFASISASVAHDAEATAWFRPGRRSCRQAPGPQHVGDLADSAPAREGSASQGGSGPVAADVAAAPVVGGGAAPAPLKGPPAPGGGSAKREERILISEVVIKGVTGDLAAQAAAALTLKPNFAYTLEEVQEDVNRVFQTGYFSNCEPVAEDTRDGVRVILDVRPNPELRGVVVVGANALPAVVVHDAFTAQHGKTLNFGAFNEALRMLNSWYEERGIFGSVVDADLSEAGICELKVTEAEVARVSVRTLDRSTGEPVVGATRPEVILRELTTKPGCVYSVRRARRDLDAIYSTGIFEDVSLVPTTSLEEPGKLDLTVNVVERKTGGFSAGGGLSARGLAEGALSGMVGSCAYTQKNLFGLNQKLAVSVELGSVEKLFRLSHVDPWVGGNPHRTSRSINIQNTRSSGTTIHGRVQDPSPEEAAAAAGKAAAGNGVAVQRLMGSVEYSRPLAQGWTGVAGVTWQRSGARDEAGRDVIVDCYGKPLTFSTTAQQDVMALGTLRLMYSGPNDAVLVLSAEQAAPLRNDWLSMTRLQARAESSFPLVGPLRLALAAKGGLIEGDLPPYEAFPIGGTNSVRGYDEGAVGSGRRYAVGSAELQMPLYGAIGGVLFCDAGSDLDTGHTVLGDPAGTRGKPGTGMGLGAGLRVDSPLGPWRLEYALNDRGARRFHLGMGKSF